MVWTDGTLTPSRKIAFPLRRLRTVGRHEYSGAGLDWTNSTGSAQTYLIRVYSPATRPALYTCMTRLRLNILSFTTDDSQAMAW